MCVQSKESEVALKHAPGVVSSTRRLAVLYVAALTSATVAAVVLFQAVARPVWIGENPGAAVEAIARLWARLTVIMAAGTVVVAGAPTLAPLVACAASTIAVQDRSLVVAHTLRHSIIPIPSVAE